MVTAVANGPDQGYSHWDTSGGNDTKDQVFLLSYAEASKYLNLSEGVPLKEIMVLTAYAESVGAHAFKTDDGLVCGWWWLRSPGEVQRSVAIINGGYLDRMNINNVSVCLRPAIWVDFHSGMLNKN